MKRARTGRPRIEERAETNEAKKPWLKLEMSRRTWYRRQAEKREQGLGVIPALGNSHRPSYEPKPNHATYLGGQK